MAGASQNEVYSFLSALHSSQQLTESDIHSLQLPSDIGKRWKKLGRELGFKKTSIDAIENENDSYSERCFDLLSRWLQKEGQQGATAGKLATALTNIELQTLADRLIGPLDGRRTICIEIEGTIELDDANQTQIMLGKDCAGKTTFFVWKSEEKEFKTSFKDLKNFVDATNQLSTNKSEERENAGIVKVVEEERDLTVKEFEVFEKLKLLQKTLSDIIANLEMHELKDEKFDIPKKLDLTNRHGRSLQELYTAVTGMTSDACKCNELVRREFYDFTYHRLRAVHNDLNACVTDLQSVEANMNEDEKGTLRKLLSCQKGRKTQVEQLEKLWIRLFTPAETQLKKSQSSSTERESRKPPNDAKNARSYSDGGCSKGIISRKSKIPFMKRKSEDKASCELLSYSETREGHS